MSYQEISQKIIFSNISSKCYDIGLPEFIIEDAKITYKKISTTYFNISMGISRETIIYISIYFACKKNQLESIKIRNLVSKINKKELNKFRNNMRTHIIEEIVK